MDLILAIGGTAGEAAKNASSAAETLSTLFQEAKVENETTKGLVDDVKALGTVCGSVSDRLKKATEDYDGESRKHAAVNLWSSVESQVSLSLEITTQLHAALLDVHRDHSDFYAQVLRQIRTHMKTYDIGEARNRIRSQTAALQVLLQTIALEVCYLAPQKVDQHLRRLLSRIEECTEQLKALQAERADQTETDCIHEKDVLGVSEAAVSEGESLYANCIATGSINGDLASFDSTRRGKIRAWIDDVDVISEKKQHSSGLNSITASDDGQGLASIATPKISLEKDFLTMYDEDFSDDELETEAARETMEKGRNAFAVHDYLGAFAYLSETLNLVAGLKDQHNVCDIWELRRMLGVSAFHTQPTADAESRLQETLQHAPKTDDKASKLQTYETAHLLAQIYTKLGNLDKASRYCEHALKGRRKILGKTDPQSYESVALMARILGLQGNSVRAEVFDGMLPITDREEYTKKFADLPPSASIVTGADISPALEPPIPPTKSARRGTGDSKVLPYLTSQVERTGFRNSAESEFSRLTIASAASSVYSTGSTHPSSTASSPVLSHGELWENKAQAGRRGPLTPMGQPAFSSRSDAPLSITSFPRTSPRSPGPTSHPHSSSHAYEYFVPDHVRSTSDVSTRSTAPSMPSINELPGVQNPAESASTLVPQPLRYQRPLLYSELPGDNATRDNSPSQERIGSVPETASSIPVMDDTQPPDYNPVEPNPAPLPPSFFSPDMVGQPGHHSPSRDLPSPSFMSTKSSDSASKMSAVGVDVKAPHPYESLAPPSLLHPADRPSLTSGDSSSSGLTAYCRPVNDVMPLRQEIRRSSEEKAQRRLSVLKAFRSPSSSGQANNKEVLSYNGIRISKTDIAAVKNENLSESVIAFWQEHLEQEILQKNEKYVFFRPAMGARLYHDMEDLTSMMEAAIPDFGQVMHIFIPLKKRESDHWSLLLISPQDECACHYDPQQRHYDSVQKKYSYRFPNNVKAAERVTGRVSALLNRPLAFRNFEDAPELINPKDSGLFTCSFIQDRVTTLHSTPLMQKTDASIKSKAVDAKSGRKMILKAIESRRKSVASAMPGNVGVVNWSVAEEA